MAEEQDPETKTEEPTQKRLEEAYEKGNVPFSREVSSFLLMGLLALMVAWFSPSMMRQASDLMTPFLANADSLPTDKEGLGHVLRYAVFGGIGVLAVPLIGAVVAALAANILQHGFILSNDPIMPKLERISPIAGFRRLFSIRSVMEFLKGIVKIVVIGFVAFVAVYPELARVKQLPNSSALALLIFLARMATRMTIGVAIAMFFIALFDIIFQRFQFIKSLRMTKQEIKDEFKQSEGDPMVKGRLRRLRQERARKRMMSAVPKADVVITNPTHFAVALIYDNKKMKAPTVVAKGQDLIALRIREIAEEHKVPIVENPPLARALFTSTDIDQEIPITHYEAVAKVISYVYQLKGKRL